MKYAIVAGFIALDFVTGLVKAFKNKNYSSGLMREGLFHKCGSVMTIGFGLLVDYAQLYFDLGTSVPVAGAICTYIILMECGSVIENLGQINPEIIPDKISSHFSKLN